MEKLKRLLLPALLDGLQLLLELLSLGLHAGNVLLQLGHQRSPLVKGQTHRTDQVTVVIDLLAVFVVGQDKFFQFTLGTGRVLSISCAP